MEEETNCKREGIKRTKGKEKTGGKDKEKITEFQRTNSFPTKAKKDWRENLQRG